jgi:hypothetical protein
MKTSYKLPFRWLVLAVWLLCGLSVSLRAEHVRTEDARRAAFTFLRSCGARCSDASELTDVSEALGFSHLYAFNGSKGYVVLAADNRVSPVLCFSEDGHIDATHLPEGLRMMLEDYDWQLQKVIEQRVEPTEEIRGYWNSLFAGNMEQTRESINLSWQTEWGIDDPFNLQCPYNDAAGFRCTTGSVATAMASLMKFWEHPKQGKGDHRNTYNGGYGTLYANFGETQYDWGNMINHYFISNEAQKAAVSMLMYHCGVSVDMRYDYMSWVTGHFGSYLYRTDFNNKIQNALVNNFYYQCDQLKSKDYYSDEQWIQMIKDALSADPPRPILYGASENESNHTEGFVCHGWKNVLGTDFIYLDCGKMVGSVWCRINEMYVLPLGNYYNYSQCAYFNVLPDSANISVNVSLPSWGTVTGAGKYPKGNTVTLHAQPKDGRHFHRWTRTDSYGNTIQVSTSPDLTFKVDHDETYTAEFDPDQIHITVVVDPVDGGTATGTGIYGYDTECHFHAEPNVGYAFLGWYELVDGRDYCWSTNPDFTQLVHYDKTVTARFVATDYTVTLSPVPFYSSGTVSGAGTFPANSIVTVTATPTSGHHFSGWVENGTLVSNSPTYTFTLRSDRNLLAILSIGTPSSSGNFGSVVTNADGSQGVIFHVDATGVGWMVAMDDASEGCQWGPSTNVQLLPDRACNGLVALEDLSGFRNTGLIRTELGTDNDYAASQVNFDHGWYLPSAGQLRMLYSALPFVDSVLYQHGGTTISEDTYWSSTEYSSSNAASPMFTMSNSAKTSNLRVRAIRNYYSPQDNMIIAIPDSPTRGYVSVYNNGVYSYGDNAAVVANPKPGYLFDHWSEEGLPVSYNHIYTFTFTHSRRLTAHFVASGGIGTMVHNADGSEGVVFYVNPEGTEGLMVALEDASEGCQWGPATNVMTLTDRPINDIRALEDVAGYRNTGIIRASQGNDSTFAAGKVDFENGWYLPASGELRKLYAALPLIETALVRAGGQTLTEDTYWSSTEYSTSSASTPMFSMGSSSKTSSLRVRAIRRFLTSGTSSILAKSCDTIKGTVTGSGNYDLNTTVTVTAQPKPGYLFDHWSEDGLTVSFDAQYQFPFTRNRTLVANFILSGTIGSIVNNADGSQGVVFYQNAEGTEGWMVALTDVSEGCTWGPTTNINALRDYPNGGLSVMEDLSGYANTDVIRRVNGTNNDYAASLVDFDNGWYLPSAGQLRKLYAVLPQIEQSLLDAGGTLLTEDSYWSSTECSASNAYCPMFATSTSNKASSLRVRAIRSFIISDVNAVAVRPNNPAYGSVSGGGTYSYGATVTVSATPASNYVFDHWAEDGCVVSYNSNYSFVFTRTRSLEAVFVKENSIGSIVHNADGTMGVIFYTYPSGIGGLMVALEDVSEGCPWGLNEDITIMDNQSPSAVMDLLNDMCGKSNTNRIREWYSGNTNYAACKTDFANGWYLPSAGQLRKLYAVLPEIERAIVDAGGTTLTEDAYWSSTEQSAGKAWTPMFAMSSTNKTSNCRVRAIRSLTESETILANVNIVDAGTVMGTGLYDYGQPCTLKAQANESYAFLNWTCDGSVVSTDMEYSFTVLGNQTYTANFVANSCNITTAMSPANSGTVTGAGVYAIGSTCALSATPNTGYTFSNWTKGDNQVSTQSTYSFTVTESAQYTAHFVINSYAVNATASPEVGGTVSGAHSYTYGSTATLTATPAEGYTFVSWTENGAVVSTSSTYQFVVSGNRTLQANFNANTYSVTAIALPSNGGTIIGDGGYDYGTTATLTAYANGGYVFFCWFEDEDVLSFDSSVSFEVTEDHLIYAVFVENENNITQTINLAQGWNWISTYIEVDDPVTMLQMVETGLGGYGVQIKNSQVNTEFDSEWGWFGDLDDVGMTNEQMYAIKVIAPCTVTVEGTPANPANHPITINQGWNWIGFPSSVAISLEDAFAGFAQEGDKIKNRVTQIEYDPEWGWYGDFETLEPGQGYMYYSASNTPRTLVFPVGVK